MDLEQYKQLTGLEVPDNQRAFVTAAIRKARVALETALGFPLAPDEAKKNLYSERGKAKSDYWPCDVADEDLLPPDDEPDAVYRLFDLSTRATAFIDSCTSVTRVKLVHGDVTLETFKASEYALRSGANGLSRFLDLPYFTRRARWWRPCSCGRSAQVAVDAAWLGASDVDEDAGTVELPDDLKTLWADQAAWLGDRTRNIRSENRGTRSYTKAVVSSPVDEPAASAVLMRYAGPNGTAGRLPV
jgi:hypothetical protein